MKKTSVLLFCLLIASLSGITGAHTIIEGPTGTSLTGETNTYSLSIADVDAIEGVFLKILFDPVFISIEGIRANGSFSGSDVTVNINNNDGWARILLISPEGISIPNDDPVPVFDLDFCTLGNTGTIPLTLVDATYSKDFFPYDFDLTEAGSLTINPAPISPEASFSADSVEGEVPFEVTFTDTSTNIPTSWSWDFGDSATSTAQHPQHIYDTPGTYTVTLTVTNVAGSDEEVKTGYITVNVPPVPPVADFTADVTSADAPLTVQFTDLSTGSPASWAWDFDNDGSVDSTVQHPSFTYNTPGTYAVSLTITNVAGSDDEIKTGYITVNVPAVAPVADFTADVTAGDAPLSVQFTDQSPGTHPLSWSWDFGDNATSTAQHPQHIYSTPGTYSVSLTVTNSAGSDDEVKTGYITVTMPPVAPTADFTADVTEGDAPLTVQFTDLSTGTAPLSWSWDFDGDGSVDSTVQHPSFTYTTPGTYTVSLTVTNVAGSGDEVKAGYITVDVPPVAPTADFTADVTVGDAPLTVQFTDLSTGIVPLSWSWDFGDNATSTAQHPQHIYDTPGTYTVTLTVTNVAGSDDEVTIGYITVNVPPVAPTADFSADVTSGDAPLTVQFTDQSTGTLPLSWSWDFGDSATSTAQHPQHIYDTPGTYTVTLMVTNVAGSDDEIKTGYITVDVPPVAPTADFTADVTAGDAPLTVQFTDLSTGTAPLSWSWDFDGDGSVNSTVQNPSFTYNTPGTYTVSLTITNVVGSDDEIKTGYIMVNAPPAGSPDADFIANVTSGSVPLTVLFTDVSTNTPTSWSWDFGDGSSSPVQNPHHTYVSAGNYTVRLTVLNAEGTDSKTRTEYIKPVSITMPTANFTADITAGTAPLTVDFTDLSTDGIYWAWYFGDGSTSNAPNPYPHTYASPGTYDVRLVVTNSNGTSTALMSSYITVYPAEEPVVPVGAAPPAAGFVPSIPKVDQPVSPAIGPVTDVPVNTLSSSVPEFSPGESSGTNGISLATPGSGGGISDSGVQGSYSTSSQPAIPLPDAGDMPIPLTFHTMLTSCGAISGTAMFRKFGDKQEFDKMVSYLLKATGLISASIAFWLFSTIFF